MAAIDSEILVCRQNNGISENFRHTDKAGISEAHGNIGIFCDQLRDWPEVFGKLEGDNKGTSANQCANCWGSLPAQKVVRLRESRFARRPRWREIGRLAGSPLVISVAVTEQRHHETGVNEDVSGHSRYFANRPSCVQPGRSVGRQLIRPDRLWHEARQRAAGADEVRVPIFRGLRPTLRSFAREILPRCQRPGARGDARSESS